MVGDKHCSSCLVLTKLDLYHSLFQIDWTDPWLWGLIAFHFFAGFLTCVSIITQLHNFQIFLFCIYCMSYKLYYLRKPLVETKNDHNDKYFKDVKKVNLFLVFWYYLLQRYNTLLIEINRKLF